MANERTEADILNKARSAIEKTKLRSNAIDIDVRRYAARSRRIGMSFRQKIFDRAIELSGIDSAEITRRQRDNDAADAAFFETLHLRTAENAKLIAACNRQLIASYQRMEKKFSPFDPPGGPPPPPATPVRDLLNLASGVVDQFAPGVQHSFSPAPWNNQLKVLIEANQQQSSAGAFLFVWTPPRDGLLEIGALIPMNGSYWWATQHKCVETLIQQDMTAAIYVFDQQSSPENATNVASQSVFSNYQDDHPGCWTDAGNQIIDEPITLIANNVPVSGGNQIVIAVDFYFEFFTDEARGQIDFSTGEKNINAGALILTLS